VLSTVEAPFSADGGLKLLKGNLGRAVIKTSAVAQKHRLVEAPALVFHSQAEVEEAFARGELRRDFIAVLCDQGPRANGMPELHKLTPVLGVLQDEGFKVGLVTDGRMSGASGKVPAAIHVTPECVAGGPLARVRDGDIIVLDGERGVLEARVPAAIWEARDIPQPDLSANDFGIGRELFGLFRATACGAEQGASVFGVPETTRAAQPSTQPVTQLSTAKIA
jgi:phosphogluconate dehydratase